MAKNVVVGYGNVGKLLVADLLARGERVVVAHYKPLTIEGAETVVADATNTEQVAAACTGANRIFITVGLPYKLKVWQAKWPTIITNVIAAAQTNSASIVFFDNIYIYGPSPLQNPITESHLRQPISKKGALRLSLINELEQAMQNGVPVLIVRAADFYGPNVSTSGVTSAIEALQKGKTAYFMGDASTKHTYAYVPDIAAAVVRLALDTDTYNQTWHLPTSGALTGTDFMQQVSAAVGNKGKWSVMTRGSMRFLGIFVPILLELREMMYQFEHDYVLDSSKFAAKYPDFTPTTYEQGIKATIDAIK
jgi:nucleoside-diphosphate-sugar epimerase